MRAFVRKAAAAARPEWTLICDFDGTIAREDVTDILLERFAGLEWKLIERSWQAGRLSSRECLGRQVELLELSRAELNAMLPQIALDPDFSAFVAAAQSAGCDVRIASEGFHQVIRALLARAGVPRLPIAATYLIAAGSNSWMLGFPFAQGSCDTDAATCKCALAAEARQQNRRVALIGDGLSDFCVARRADLVFARGRLLEYCRTNAIEHRAAADFASVIRQLGMLFDGVPRHAETAALAEESYGG
ncbi:MAG: MtnX-like HAD-IB family phosphatase [Gammaproteobacteria bacterium]